MTDPFDNDPDPRPLAAATGAPTEGLSTAATDGLPALRTRHGQVLARIAAAARACGRDPGEVSLLAVSKTFDADAVLELARCGQRDFAENYLQEALAKQAECGDRWSVPASGRDIERLAWHFIGPIQSNKTRAIAESFDWVHSVDREKVARRLSEQRPADRSPLQVCIQVDVSGEATKSGCDPDEAVALARVVASLPGLRLRGVMAIPAPTDDPTRQRAQFARVREVWQRIRDAGVPVDTLSMGMSGDLEAAVAEGATIVRIGTALFGTRPAKTASG